MIFVALHRIEVIEWFKFSAKNGSLLEWFSLFSKSDWFYITTVYDWIKKLPSLFQPIRSRSHSFSRAFRRVLIGSLYYICVCL